jgi:hypothetical protein
MAAIRVVTTPLCAFGPLGPEDAAIRLEDADGQ